MHRFRRNTPNMTKYKRHFAPVSFLLLLVTVAIIGCASPNKAYDPQQPVSESNKPYVPNETGTKIVSYGNQAAPLVPAPYNGLLIGVLGLATATMGWFAKRKNDQAASSGAQLVSVIKGVEDAGDDKVKVAIEARAKAAGVDTALHTLVKKVT